MNIKYISKYFAGGLLISILAGCSATQNTINTKNVLNTTKDVTKIKIKLPARYSVENFRDVSLVTNFAGDKDTKDIIDLIETDMMSIKKFTQYARHFADKANLRDEMHREDGGADIKASKVAKESDYILAVNVTKTKTEQKINDTKSVILFTVELKYQINSTKDNTNITSGVIEGLSKRYKLYKAQWDSDLRMNFYDLVGGHGFNGTEAKSDIDAFRQASRRASETLKYRVGNAFPSGGAITLWREASNQHQIKIDAGINQGVMKNQYFIIYASEDEIDTPIALTKVSGLSAESTILTFVRWKKGDVFAQKIIDNLKKSNYKDAMKKEFYAVAVSMPDPIYKED
jgi:hypothetical protein